MSDISKKVNIVHHWLIDLYSHSSSCSSARNPEACKRKRLNTVNFHKGQMIIRRAARWRGTKTGFWRVLMNLCTINEMLFSSKGNSHSVTAGKYNNKQLFTQAPGRADFFFFSSLVRRNAVKRCACLRARVRARACPCVKVFLEAAVEFSQERLQRLDKTRWTASLWGQNQLKCEAGKVCSHTHWRARTHTHTCTFCNLANIYEFED